MDVGSDRQAALEGYLASHRAVRVALWLALFGALMFFRLPTRYLQPFFFAEEGPLYFHHAYHHSLLDALRTTKLGYFAGWTNLACTLAAHAVPLEYAPAVTTAMGTLLWAGLLALVALPSGPLASHTARLAAVAVLILIPVHDGKTHASFAQYYLCFATALVLVSGAGAAWERWFRRLMLLVAGTSGMQPLFLAPLFVWKWLRRGREREVLVQIGILAACGALQAGVLLWTMQNAPEEVSTKRWTMFEPGVFGGAITTRSLVAPFAGEAAMKAAGAWFFAALTAVPRAAAYWAALAAALAGWALALALIVGPARLRAPATRGLALAYLTVTLLSFVGAITNQDGTKSLILLDHARYFAAPNLMLGTALLVHATSPVASRWRALYRVLVAWVLVVGAYVYVAQPDPNLVAGPDWRAEIAAWRQDPRRPVHTWPPPWRMRLLPRPP